MEDRNTQNKFIMKFLDFYISLWALEEESIFLSSLRRIHAQIESGK